MRSDWCAGCDHTRPRRDMRFVAGWMYRCDHCRHVPAAPKITKPAATHWPRLAQVVAAAVCVWITVDVAQDSTRLEQQERDHVADAQRQLDASDRALRQRAIDQLDQMAELHQHRIDYPPVGAVAPADSPSLPADSPPLPNGSHYHCEQETFSGDVTGISLPISVGGAACSFRWPDGSIAPPPSRP